MNITSSLSGISCISHLVSQLYQLCSITTFKRIKLDLFRCYVCTNILYHFFFRHRYFTSDTTSTTKYQHRNPYLIRHRFICFHAKKRPIVSEITRTITNASCAAAYLHRPPRLSIMVIITPHPAQYPTPLRAKPLLALSEARGMNDLGDTFDGLTLDINYYKELS